MEKTNSVYFNKEQFENGEMDRFIHCLNEMSYGESKDMFQILIIPEDIGAYSVKFIQIPWDHSFGGRFAYVDEDEEIMLEKVFPDGHYEYFHSEEEYQDELSRWQTGRTNQEKSTAEHQEEPPGEI